MKRLLPIIVLGPLFLGGAALAQSITGFSMPEFEVAQIDPPSLDLDVGPSDIDVEATPTEAQEAIETVANGAWEGQPAAGEGAASLKSRPLQSRRLQ